MRGAHLQSYVDRFRYKADKAKQAQSRLKMIAKLEPITRPQEAALRRFSFLNQKSCRPLYALKTEPWVMKTPQPVCLDLRIDQDDRIALLGKTKENQPCPS